MTKEENVCNEVVVKFSFKWNWRSFVKGVIVGLIAGLLLKLITG